MTRWLSAGAHRAYADAFWPAKRLAMRWHRWLAEGRLSIWSRVRLLVMSVLALVVGGAATAWAAASPTPDGGVMSTFDAVSSAGVRISQVQLQVDQGGMTAPVRAVLALLLGMAWDGYRMMVGLGIWIYRMAAGFGWMPALLTPARAVAQALQTTIDQLGMIPFLLTVAAAMCGVVMLRGRWATGLAELSVSLMAVTLMTGVLANPVEVIAGPNGLLGGAQKMGVQISASIALAGNPGAQGQTSEALQKSTEGALVDAFIIAPHQLVNYGRVLPAACQAKYLTELRGGPYTDGSSTVRDAVKACDSASGDYAANPSTEQVMGASILLFGGTVLVVLLIVLAVILLLASAVMAFESSRVVVGLTKAIIPGAGREGLYTSFGAVAASLGAVVGLLAFLSAYVLAIRTQIANTTDPAAAFVTVDLLLVVAIIIVIKWRSQAKETAERIASRFSRMGMGGNSGGGGRSGNGAMVKALVGGAIGTRLTTYGMASKARKTLTDNGSGAGVAGGGAGGLGGSLAARSAAKRPTKPAKGAALAAQRVGTVAKVVAMSTVGAPVYGPRAVVAMTQAAQVRRQVMAARLAKQAGVASDFAHEYKNNVTGAARFVGSAARAEAEGLTAVGGSALAATSRAAVPVTTAATLATGLASSSRAAAPRPRSAQVSTASPGGQTGRSQAPGVRPRTASVSAVPAPSTAMPVVSGAPTEAAAAAARLRAQLATRQSQGPRPRRFPPTS